jgi:hypothetical protein
MTRVIWILAIAGCSVSDRYVDGFSPPDPAPGHTRLIAPTIPSIAPGADQTYCQWLAEPSDVDRQIVDMQGYQSRGGHHLVLYATTVVEPVGTSRICTDEDMLSITFVGAIGGEGNDVGKADLPEGLAFGVPKGLALMANTHYFNATDETFDGQSVADVKFGDPAHPLSTVGFVSVVWNGFAVPNDGKYYTSDASCTADKQFSFIMWANHMHETGTSVFSEVMRTDGSVVSMARDDSWSPEQAFNSPFSRWGVATPMVVNPGDQFHVSCTWLNTTGGKLVFPREMCIGFGFTLEAMPQTICLAK